jgi:hypothetical protein
VIYFYLIWIIIAFAILGVLAIMNQKKGIRPRGWKWTEEFDEEDNS